MDAALCDIEADGPGPEPGQLPARTAARSVRARLDLELCGPVRTDVSWQNVLVTRPTPGCLATSGSSASASPSSPTTALSATLDDDYEHLETVTEPGRPGHRLPAADRQRDRLSSRSGAPARHRHPAGRPVRPGARRHRHPADDHLYLPQQFIDPALVAMAVCFRAGPLLSAATEEGEATLRSRLRPPAPGPGPSRTATAGTSCPSPRPIRHHSQSA